jgi:hypothetical protein
MARGIDCSECGKRMRKSLDGRGYLGQGYFCTLTCGYRYGRRVVDQKDEYIRKEFPNAG